MLQWPDDEGSCGVVDDQRYAEASADLGDLGDREDLEFRIGKGLGIIGAGPIVGRPGERFRIGGIDEAGFDAEALQRRSKQRPGAAIDASRAYDVVAGARKVEDGEGGRRLSRGERQRGCSALEFCQALLEGILRRIGDARVEVAGRLQRKKLVGAVSAGKLERRCLVDRHGHRAGNRVEAETAAVQRDRFRMAPQRAGTGSARRQHWGFRNGRRIVNGHAVRLSILVAVGQNTSMGDTDAPAVGNSDVIGHAPAQADAFSRACSSSRSEWCSCATSG